MRLLINREAVATEFYDSYGIHWVDAPNVPAGDGWRYAKEHLEGSIRIGVDFPTLSKIGGLRNITLMDDGLLFIEVWVEDEKLYSDYKVYADGTTEVYGVPIPQGVRRFIDRRVADIRREVSDAVGVYRLVKE